MEKRALGKTGFSVTALGHGAMALRELGEAEAADLLNAVLDSGINYIDTSPDYGPSETSIGRALSHRRGEFLLASKCGCNIDENGKLLKPEHIWTRERLERNLENSLRVLRTDHLDVWQLHSIVPAELSGGKADPVIRVMQDAKRAGKVRAIGISFKNGRPGDPLYPGGYGARDIPALLEWGVFDVMQIVYGPRARQSERAIAAAAGAGVGTILRGVFRKYFEDMDAVIERTGLDALCEPGETRSAFLLRFVLSHPGASTIITGTKSREHLQGNIRAAAAGKLSDAVYTEAKRRLAAAGIAAAP